MTNFKEKYNSLTTYDKIIMLDHNINMIDIPDNIKRRQELVNFKNQYIYNQY